ncbi:MAG: hypothetical protein KA419_15460 [Acidobacteria bacterium]|nr:hypothetical protein [Acidobacteriota bacterium]
MILDLDKPPQPPPLPEVTEEVPIEEQLPHLMLDEEDRKEPLFNWFLILVLLGIVIAFHYTEETDKDYSRINSGLITFSLLFLLLFFLRGKRTILYLLRHVFFSIVSREHRYRSIRYGWLGAVTLPVTSLYILVFVADWRNIGWSAIKVAAVVGATLLPILFHTLSLLRSKRGWGNPPSLAAWKRNVARAEARRRADEERRIHLEARRLVREYRRKPISLGLNKRR